MHMSANEQHVKNSKYINIDTVIFLVTVSLIWFVFMGGYCIKAGVLYWTFFLFLIPVALIFAIPKMLEKLVVSDTGVKITKFNKIKRLFKWEELDVNIVRKIRGRRVLEYLLIKEKDGEYKLETFYSKALQDIFANFYHETIPYINN